MDYEEEHADDEDNVEPEELEDEDTKASKVGIKSYSSLVWNFHAFIPGTHKTRTNCSQQNY
jgi:hypothetical protein